MSAAPGGVAPAEAVPDTEGMIHYLQIALLALIQGAAELLPVSSSAHVILAARFMGLDPSSTEFTFLLVMLHTGTMFAVLAYFGNRWKALLFPAAPPPGKEVAGPSRSHFLSMIVVATAVTGVVGFGLKELIERVVLVRVLGHDKAEVEHLFKNLYLMAGSLCAVGLVIIAAGVYEPRGSQPLTARPSALIGLIQGLCLPFRGFSRSGATISMGLFCGIPRQLAEEFSFALAVVLTPPVIALELHRLLRSEQWQGRSELMELLLPGVVGMAFSFAAGLVALKLLSAVLEGGKWKYFGYYCVAAAVVVLVVARGGL